MTDDTPLTDRILDLIDNGLQSSTEPACDAGSPELCARCQRHEPAEGGEMCVGCRAYLLEDSEEDPKDPLSAVTFVNSQGNRGAWQIADVSRMSYDPAGNDVIIIDDLNTDPPDRTEVQLEQMRAWWERRVDRAAELADASHEARAERQAERERERTRERIQLLAEARVRYMRNDLSGFTHISSQT